MSSQVERCDHGMLSPKRTCSTCKTAGFVLIGGQKQHFGSRKITPTTPRRAPVVNIPRNIPEEEFSDDDEDNIPVARDFEDLGVLDEDSKEIGSDAAFPDTEGDSGGKFADIEDPDETEDEQVEDRERMSTDEPEETEQGIPEFVTQAAPVDSKSVLVEKSEISPNGAKNGTALVPQSSSTALAGINTGKGLTLEEVEKKLRGLTDDGVLKAFNHIKVERPPAQSVGESELIARIEQGDENTIFSVSSMASRSLS